MKQIYIIIVAIFCFTATVAAQRKLRFIVGDDVCAPITVRCQGYSYQVNSYLEVNQTSSSITVTATDCNGNKLKYDFGSDSGNGYSICTYTFHNTYNYSSNSNSSYNNSSRYNNENYESAERAGRAIGRSIFSLGGGSNGKAYPSLQAQIGASRAYGDFARLRYSGHGVNLYGSVGKDWMFDSEFKDKILWNVGMGSYFAFGGDGDPTMDIGIGVSIGQTAQWEKLSLMFDADYTYWIGRWRRVGLFAGGSLGWGSFTEMFNTKDYEQSGGFAWNLEVGITFRLANL